MSAVGYVERFANAMGVLGEVFNEPVSDVRIEAYADSLRDLNGEAVLAALAACVRECKFFPRPAEIRERVTGKDDDRAELAWGELLTAVQRVGYTRWPSLPEETMATVQGVWGSWERLCQTLPGEGPELLGWRKTFIASYGAHDRTDKRLKAIPANVAHIIAEANKLRLMPKPEDEAGS